MSCYLCGSEKYREILNKPEVCIWTSTGDEGADRKRKHKCVLNQCEECGHVYQPITEELRNILKEIYLSDNAQASTPTGVGNWGLERAKVFLNKIGLRNYASTIELGCARGYILRCLKQRGFKKLVGIDPSLSRTEEVDGILFLKEFANEKLQLPQKYDFIFSNSVFEHIEDINSVMDFCKNNLSENSNLFFTVPNAQSRLEDGDPGLFLHQHVHYYTEQSIEYLLAKNGFEIKSMVSIKDSLDVSAQIKKSNKQFIPKIVFYDDYQKKLEKILTKIQTILQGDKVIIHGVNNSLNNILTWLKQSFDFVLIDNDETKRGKRYFNRLVGHLADIELADYNTVLIVPVAFYETIKTEYIQRDFHGKIENILL